MMYKIPDTSNEMPGYFVQKYCLCCNQYNILIFGANLSIFAPITKKPLLTNW